MNGSDHPVRGDADMSEAVPAAGIDRAWIARCLARGCAELPTPPEDLWHQYTIPPEQPALHAAVLVPLVGRETGVQVLLTQRTDHLHGHAGQISFPGGRVEPHDQHRADTALRETEEEIGIARDRIEVLGVLPVHEVQSGYRVTPVVGWITPPYELQLDPFEVQDAFEVPLEHFLHAANYQRRSYRLEGVERRYLAIPYAGRYIWGATAAMLHMLQRLLRR
jgi:8-oxo-dGTP pyrophosphatase MutT (NUDIX family)